MKQVSKTVVSIVIVLSFLLSSTLVMDTARSDSLEASETPAQIPVPTPTPLASDYPFRTVYPSLANLYAWYNTLVTEYPGLVSKINIGKSWQNRDMWVLNITSNEEGVTGNKPAVLIEGNIHAREWSTSNAAAYFAWFLLYNYNTNDTIHWLLNNRQIYILPMVNPDGYYYDGDGVYANRLTWRKNRNITLGDGVDLNRNWDADWINGVNIPTDTTYHGAAPFSEYETKNIRNFILTHNIESFQCLHTYAGTLLIPWCYQDVNSPHETWYRSTAGRMTSLTTQLGAATTYSYGRPAQTIGYSAPGGSIDWTYLAKGIQSYCFELYTGNIAEGFYPATTSINAINQDVDDALLYQSRVADTDLGNGVTALSPPVPYIVFGHVYGAGSILTGTPVTITNTATGEALTINTDSNGYYEVDFGKMTMYKYTTAQTFNIAASSYSMDFTIDGLWGKKVDLNAGATRAALTVAHWGPSGATITQARYFRGLTGENTVNTLTSNSLGTAQSSASSYYQTSVSLATSTYAGIRVWKRTSAGVETEITAGTAVATVSRTTTTQGLMTGTAYTPTATALAAGDSIVIRLYVATSIVGLTATALRANFTTEPLGPGTLSASAWTVSYYVRRGTGQLNGLSGSYVAWGMSTFNSNIAGFRYVTTSTPITHNTLNWTTTGTGVTSYKIYRCATQTGTYQLIGSVPSTTYAYVDNLKGTADTTYWWYIVLGEDGTGTDQTSNALAVQEPGAGTPYAISLTGKTAGTWVFVSFPHAISGNIQTLLNDAALGDGQTAWTVAKWFNPQTPADPWKTYRSGSAVNDMPTITNTMGVWLWLTVNGGDQMLTLSSSGSYSATAVNINLYTGWNLVGYPSATGRTESVTLPAAADLVATWQAASPFITDHAKGAATMSHGNAYWIHVTADCTWTVQP
jgi:hypothetical protein